MFSPWRPYYAIYLKKRALVIDSAAAFCRTPWFERLAIAVLVSFAGIHFPFLCGVPGPFSALTWTTSLLLMVLLAVMSHSSSLQ